MSYSEPCRKHEPGRLPVAPLVMMLAALVLFPSGAASQSTQELRLTAGRSVVIDYPTDIGRISTSSPDVVDYIAVTTREILVHAKNHGTATVIVWSKTGQREFYNVTVEHNLEPIRKLLKGTFPGEDIQIQAARDTVTLTGKVSTREVGDRATAVVAPLVKTVVNNLQVAPAQIDKQILLKVKFAELNRNDSLSLGVNFASTGPSANIGSTSTGQFPAPKTAQIGGAMNMGQGAFSITDALNVFAFRPDLNLAAFVRLLQSRGLLQILAEPNLVTTNGKEASFLVGGEFPVPVLQGGSNAGSVTIQFREFGIRLTFNPQITVNQTLKMYVRPEVSTIDMANAVNFSGFTIPALATRRMETNIELSEGQSFVIAGLMDDRVTESMSKMPGLANIPLLGVLFKSRNENKSKTELMVMVTPEIVNPLNPGDAKPNPDFPKPFLAPLPPASSGGTGKNGGGTSADPAKRSGKATSPATAKEKKS
jgi:pilus assembly protein CpaC